MTALLVAAGVAGLAIGSFLNVVIHRLPRGESLRRPGSHCPACTAPVPVRYNIPVLGWLLCRGRCGACGAPVSLRYPLVELVTGLLFVAVAARFHATAALPAYLYLAAVAVALAVIDLRVWRLPDAIVLPSYGVGAVLLGAAAIARTDWWAAGRGLIAMAVLFGVYLLIALARPGGMGLGDVKLAGLLGLYLGFLGWSPLWVGAFAGFLLGGLAGAALLLTRRTDRRGAIPFGPFMLAGALVAVFFAGPIGAWYGSLLPGTA